MRTKLPLSSDATAQIRGKRSGRLTGERLKPHGAVVSGKSRRTVLVCFDKGISKREFLI
jgi:hypothetical protein